MHREIEANWRQGDLALTPPDETLDIWRIDLSASTKKQRARAHKARLIILARYLGVEPDGIELAPAPGGKPQLVSPDSSLQFNLSHTRGAALLAIHASRPVGVDLEHRRRIDDPVRLARRVMSAAELMSLETCSANARTALFLDLWTRLEARQKTLGRGIFAKPVDPDAVFSASFSAGEGLRGCVAIDTEGTLPDLRFFDFGRE